MSHVIATERYIAHLKSKRQEKENEEKKKNERKEERKRKKTQKEGAKKKKTVADEDEAMGGGINCEDCVGEYCDDDYDDRVECDACHQWFHVVCTTLFNLTNAEISKINVKCNNC